MEIKNKQSIFKFPLFLLIGVIIFSFGFNVASAASTSPDNSTIYVNNTIGNDTWDGQSIVYTGTSGPKKTITNAIGTVATNGTIYVASGIYNESNIQITTNMSIIGENQQNTIIDAQGNSNIFYIPPGSVINFSLINLTLENGANTKYGGAIDFENDIGYAGVLNIENVTFTNNTANNYGGAIYNDGGTVIESCNTYISNSANVGGAIFNLGNLTITSDVFKNNTATNGGAIYNEGNLNETNTIFNNNAANIDGGAIFNAEGILVDTNNIYTNNRAQLGGTLYNDGYSTVTETNNTFNNNTATSNGGAIFNAGILNETKITYTNNTANNKGGAIYNLHSSTVTETNNIFRNNSAYYGGAVFNDNYETITETNNSFNNNTAYMGGAIYNGCILTENNDTFTNNIATYEGGAICNFGTITEIDATFSNNTSQYGGTIFNEGVLNETNNTYTNNTATVGGVIYNNEEGTVTETNTTYINNTATTGGAIYTEGNITETNNIFNNNTANGEGGAIYNANPGIITETNNTYKNNKAIYGGAIYNDVGTLTQTNNAYTNNTAQYGGAIYNNEGTLNQINITFKNNGATDYGGAVFNDYYGIIKEINNTYTNNTAPYGGAIYSNYYSTLNQTNNTYTNNTASYNGGAIYNNYYSTLTQTKNTFIKNTSNDGGAIYNDCNLTDTNDTFTNNIANNRGGAIFNSGINTINNSILNNNNALFGGAIYNYYGNLTVTNCTLQNNTASEGGAIYNYDATLNVNCNTFKNNDATNNGSTIYNLNEDSAGTVYSIVEFNRIIGNTDSKNEIFSTDDSVNANLNWWGSNSNPSNYVNSNVNVTSWLVLAINAAPTNIPNYSNATINVDLMHDNQGNLESNSIPDGLIVNYTSNLGSMDISSIIIDGNTQCNLYSGTKAGLAIVSAIVDNQLLNIDIIIGDTIKPTVDITSPSNNTYVHGNVPIQVTVTDNVGVNKIVFNINGNNYIDTNKADGWTYNWITTDLNDGVYNITATAYDTANNSQNQTIQMIVDNIIPTVTVNIKGGLYKFDQTVTLKMNDAGNIYYTLNNTLPTAMSTLYTKPIIISSTSTLKYIAIDYSDNKSPAYQQNYIIDKTIPKISSTAPVNNAKGVSLISKITIKYSEKIGKGTKYTKIYIKNMTTGKITHSIITISGNTMTIKMKRSRLSLDNYRLYIPASAVKDLAGNNNDQYALNFKTSKY